MLNALQTSLFDLPVPPPLNDARSGVFTDNMKLPVHGWFRYSAGFSAQWVAQEIQRIGVGAHVLDPFAGSGTVLFEAEKAGAHGIGLEPHPFVWRVARAKLDWRSDLKHFLDLAREILADARPAEANASPLPPLLAKCFSPDYLRELLALRDALARRVEETAAWRLCWLAFISIIRASSSAGTAQWQYVLPNKSKVNVEAPRVAFLEKVLRMAGDMRDLSTYHQTPSAQVLREDARRPQTLEPGWADLVITSPPYANNYDYADATRLEMSVLGEIGGWGDLQKTVRTHLMRSCTQHVASYADATDALLESALLEPIKRELSDVVHRLEAERHLHGGKKPYYAMIAHYFHDLAEVWVALRRYTSHGGQVCFVVGDSAPYGIHAPVERWLGELALAAGFSSWRFEKIRDRNTKWKNRKHQVPLHEGRLWVNG